MEALAVPAINRILRRNSWALDRLKPYAGDAFRLDLPLASLLFAVAESGELAAATPDAQARVTMVLSPGVMLRLLARDESVWKDVPVSGDTDFATALNHIWHNLHWDIEEDLARVFGDIAAHRMVQAGRTLNAWGARSFDGIARNFAEYWTEERPLIARAREVEQFVRDVDCLRDDVARLEKRIDQLSRRG